MNSNFINLTIVTLATSLFHFPAIKVSADPVPTEMTLSYWESLSIDEKSEILDGYPSRKYKNIVVDDYIGEDEINLILKKTHGTALIKATNYLIENTYLHDESPHSTVGKPQLRFVYLTSLSSGELLGARIGIYQEGCDMPEFAESTASEAFATTEEALAAGCEFSDVNWSAYGFFDANGEAISTDEAFEWSGY